MGLLGRLWRSICAYARKGCAAHLATFERRLIETLVGDNPFPYCDQLCWYRDGKWVPLTVEEVEEYLKSEAW